MTVMRSRVCGFPIVCKIEDSYYWTVTILPELYWWEKPFHLRCTYSSLDMATAMACAMSDIVDVISEFGPDAICSECDS
jgi:hypothetical protein